MNYSLVRSGRKTCGIYIRNGTVEVRAPLHFPKREIERFLTSKEGWIRQKLGESAAALEERRRFSLNYGSRILYRGREYPICPGERAGFDGERFCVPPDLPPEEIKAACIRIYRRLAGEVLTEKVQLYARKMGVAPAAVRIHGAKTRWGSCSSRGNLNFSWRLMMAPDSAIDYVTVHELAHLKEMNHSAAFRAVVEEVLPDYRERCLSLKTLQKRLNQENWD